MHHISDPDAVIVCGIDVQIYEITAYAVIFFNEKEIFEGRISFHVKVHYITELFLLIGSVQSESHISGENDIDDIKALYLRHILHYPADRIAVSVEKGNSVPGVHLLRYPVIALIIYAQEKTDLQYSG